MNGENNNPIIKVRDVRFRYSESEPWVLNGIDLDIFKGEFIAFVGQNGAGKTTLVKHFNGLLLPTEGQILLNDQDTRKLSIENTARVVGYCYQNPDHQIFAGSVTEEIAFGPKNLGMTKEQVDAAVEHAIKLVGLEDSRTRYPFMLGRGERQKLAVASILAMNSPILIVDEPTTGMDIRGSRSIMKLLSEWHAAGQTILVITHDMNIVAEFVPTMVVMAQGKVLAKRPTREVMADDELLKKSFLRPPQVTRMAKKLEAYNIRTDVLTVAEMLTELKQRLTLTEHQE
jgi:energy-coupling factor transporter ATP-binding protein EcfA2